MVFEQIENVNAYNCLLASVATLAKYYGRDYQMVSGGDWKLRYDEADSNKRIGEQIDVVSQVDITSRTMQFHGFMWEMETFKDGHFEKDTESFKEFKGPILVSVDLYYCKWSNFYHNYHFFHYIIVCDYDFNGEMYTCIDPYFQYSQYKVCKEDLFKSMDRYGKFNLFEMPSENSEVEYIKVIQEDIILVNQANQNYKNIKRLANDIQNKLDIHYEFDEYKNNLNAVPIMDKIRKIAMCREAYSCMLDYVYKLHPIQYLNDASSLIKQSVVLWKTIQGKLLKTYLTDSIHSERETLSLLIEKIADIEEQAVRLILIQK